MELQVLLICRLLSVQGYVFKQLKFYMNMATSKLLSNEDYVLRLKASK